MPDDGATRTDDEEQDYGHLFRNEGIVSDFDLRVHVADNYTGYIAGDEDIEVDVAATITGDAMRVVRGARTREVDEYERATVREETIVANRIEETVHGGVHQKARFAAEGIVGGAYVNTIAGPYLRLAGWTDFLAWGGWAEVDLIRCELSLLMIRSHVGYAHAAGVRVVRASRLIDDFQTRSENFGVLSESGATYTDTGAPGGGVTNEA